MKNKKVTKKNMTIDDLALMVGKGFRGMDERFDKVEDRLMRAEEDVTTLKQDMSIVKDLVKFTRRDVLDLGEKFVSHKQFDGLALRVGKLENVKK